MDHTIYEFEDPLEDSEITIGYQPDDNLTLIGQHTVQLSNEYVTIAYNTTDDTDIHFARFDLKGDLLTEPISGELWSFAILRIPNSEHLSIESDIEAKLEELISNEEALESYSKITHQMFITSPNEVYIMTPEGYWNVETKQINPDAHVSTFGMKFKVKPTDQVVLVFTPKMARLFINGQQTTELIYSEDYRDRPIIKIILLQGQSDQFVQDLERKITTREAPFSQRIEKYQLAPFQEIVQLLSTGWVTAFKVMVVDNQTHLMFDIRSGEMLFTPGKYNPETNQISPE